MWNGHEKTDRPLNAKTDESRQMFRIEITPKVDDREKAMKRALESSERNLQCTHRLKEVNQRTINLDAVDVRLKFAERKTHNPGQDATENGTGQVRGQQIVSSMKT